MISFLIRIIIYGIAIAVTSWLMPGIEIVNNSLLTYILLGLGFGLINAFVRPFVLLITSRLVILTMGWFILIINALMLLLLGYILPEYLTVSGLIAALIGGLMMAVIAMGLEAIFGLARPVGVETEVRAPSWYGLDKLPFGYGNRLIENLRVQEVYQTFWRYGTDIALARSPVGAFRNWMQKSIYNLTGERVHLSVPAKVRIMLQELGPTYVKLGQLVSSRAQSLPLEWQEELARLQSNVPPFPSETAVTIFEEELEAPPEAFFDDFEAEPFAAASTAQVHRASLDGQLVVVKIQRPNIVPQVRADLGIIHDVATVLERRTEWAVSYNLVGTVDEFGSNIVDELDYRKEAFNALRLGMSLETYPNVHVPKIYNDLTSAKILTMEFVRGTKISNIDAIDEAGLDRDELATTFIGAMIKQVLFDGFFHADPHPGNVLVDLESGMLIFLDMGMMGYLDKNLRVNMADLLYTLKSEDVQELGRIMLNLSTEFRPVNEQAFYRDLDRVLTRYMKFAQATDTFSDTMGATLGLMQQHGLRLNKDLTMALKAMMQAEEAARVLAPSRQLVDVAFEEAKDLLMSQLNTDYIKDVLVTEATRTAKDVVRRIPSLQQATLSWLDQYESGKLTLHVDTRDLAEQIGVFSTATRYLTLGIILIGMLIGAALAANMPQSALWPFLPDVAQLIFFFALIFSGIIVTRMAWRLWWN